MIRFLFKSAFFLTLIFVAIAFFAPAPDQANRDTEAGSHSALDALFAMRSALADLGSFCERNRETCETGKSFFGSLGVKAREGARITYEFLDAKFGHAAHPSSDAAKNGPAEATPPALPHRPASQTVSQQKKHDDEKQHTPR